MKLSLRCGSLFLGLVLSSGAMTGCDVGSFSSTGTGGGGGTTTTGAAGDTADPGVGGALKGRHAAHFPIGTAVSAWHLDNLPDIVTGQFNHLTAENAMKAKPIHPAEGTWSFAEADRIADVARDHGMKMTGHAMIWHRETPDWMFAGVTPGDPAGIELVKARLAAHIEGMVERYGDVVDNWDVVNEALSDDPAKVYRDGAEGSKWYEVFGGEEYIYWAFKYTRDALEAREPGGSKGKLYYNEYTVTLKVDHILEMAAWLRDEKGIQIDGVGFQSHENLDWPSAADLQTAIDKVVAAGYEVKISELDVTVYSDYPGGVFMPQPEVEYTPGLAAKQAARYRSLFDLYRKNDAHITSVTFWGVSDDHTWLDTTPVVRDDHPLLWDDAHQPKEAFFAVTE